MQLRAEVCTARKRAATWTDLRHTQCEQKTNTGENTTRVKFKNWQNYGDKSQDNDGVGMLLTGRGREGALWGAGTLSMSIWVAVTQG